MRLIKMWKREISCGTSSSSKCTIEENFDFENNEIKFNGTIKFLKNNKTNKRIMYLSTINGNPAVAYFLSNKKPITATNEEIRQMYEKIKEIYGIDLY